MVSFALHATPKLTVVVMVDGLTQTNLDALRPYWTQGGLRTLTDEAFKATLTYPHLVYGGDETVVTLLTGEQPSRHGYSADTYFDRTRRQEQVLLYDADEQGIGTSAHLSARTILCPTLTDRLRMAYPEAKIYAIGLRPTTTLVMAGHAANACCWLDAVSQQWVSTTYYQQGLPTAADAFNQSGRIAEVTAQTWIPRMAVTSYLHPTAEERKKGFDYPVSKHLLFTPMANTLVVEMALALQQSAELGKDHIPDLLCLEMTTLSPHALSDAIETAEQEDMYLRLNQDLGYLMEQLNRRIGADNYRLAVIGIPRLGMSQAEISNARIPLTTFHIDQAFALLNTYLMALYGHERWVDGALQQGIYLNRTLIEQKRLDLNTIQRQAANFIQEFEGVRMTYTATDILNNTNLIGSFNKKTLADVIVLLQNDWQTSTSPLLFYSGERMAYPAQMQSATELIHTLKP